MTRPIEQIEDEDCGPSLEHRLSEQDFNPTNELAEVRSAGSILMRGLHRMHMWLILLAIGVGVLLTPAAPPPPKLRQFDKDFLDELANRGKKMQADGEGRPVQP